MIYKKFEISLSLNGENVIHIARNYAGIVVFRAETESEIRRMIDDSIEEQVKKEKEAEELKLKKEEDSKSKPKRGLFQPPVEEKVEEENVNSNTEIDKSESVLMPPPHQRVTRGPDGKFISKSQLQETNEEEEKKKSFWDKLTS